jgi:hypothetical protein
MIETLDLPKQINEADWFDNFVATLRVHKMQLDTYTASNEIRKMYDVFFSGNTDNMASMSKNNAQRHFVSKMLVDYVGFISKNSPLKLAFDFNDSNVLVWAEIPDDDELMERILIMAEAKINAKYHDFGFDMTTTLVETRDYLSIPNHYVSFND